MFMETCVAPVNIALIKYWGKRNSELILPINDSLSMTLGTDELCAKTTTAACQSFKRSVMWLNGEEVPLMENPRIARCLNELQRLALAKGNLKFPVEWHLHIASKNNFPTAAGLASSAAGYACLVYALACLYGVEDEDLSPIARLGSGSACRSLNGGFVRWSMGVKENGSDSIAIPVALQNHWPNMHVLILVVNDSRKKTSSSKGMQLAVETSELITFRAKYVVPKRIEKITKAILQKDFKTFAEITMKESNQFHAIAMDTYPPCIYMNHISHYIVDFVHAYNEAASEIQVAYTFDAGPNSCLYMLEENVSKVLASIQQVFPNDFSNDVEYIKGIPVEPLKEQTLNGNSSFTINKTNLLKYIIHTKIGAGPKKLSKEDSLLSSTDGFPCDA